MELWLHAGSLESTQEVRVAPRATLTLLSMTRLMLSLAGKHEPILIVNDFRPMRMRKIFFYLYF